ncbi:MAG: aminopeptidase P family N-terminal domain-containing protein, partial [Dethiobacteria bacterium]|nr:aminopeptidase P family N-terminal domain-containing protein [Dethiobacteria bacterium]
MQNEDLDLLKAQMQKEGLSALFIAPSEEMTFLFGQSPSLCERFQGMFITSSGELFYICNLLYRDEVTLMFGSFAEIFSWFDGDSFTALTGQVLKEYKLTGKKVGVNSAARASNILQIEQATGTQFVSGVQILEEVRILKSEEELENLQSSAKITDEAYLELVNLIKAGLSEREIMQMLSKIYQGKGFEHCYGIIASGSN